MRPDFYDRVAENECCRIKQDRYRCQIFLWCFTLTMKNNQSKYRLKTCRSGSIHLVFSIWSRKSTTYVHLLPVKLTCKQGWGLGGVGAMLYGVYIFVLFGCWADKQFFISALAKQQAAACWGAQRGKILRQWGGFRSPGKQNQPPVMNWWNQVILFSADTWVWRQRREYIYNFIFFFLFVWNGRIIANRIELWQI